jgi:deazaflavin-dependent oxidoreductase (nitroreductase family)
MSDWNDGVIAEFRANEGKVGGYFKGAPMILLHHIGARSGTVRVTPLVYFPQDDGSMLVVASKGGAPTNPDWYHNVLANPRFEVDVGTRTFSVDAEELGPDERAEHWPLIVAARPGFGAYETKTSRVMPVLRLRPVA